MIRCSIATGISSVILNHKWFLGIETDFKLCLEEGYWVLGIRCWALGRNVD
jgi:hypothetical protein